MGIQLIAEIMDFAPRVTAAEWKALIVLAEDANDARRKTWTRVTDDKIMRRVDMSPAAWANLRAALVRKKLLVVVDPARRGQPATYRFPDYRSMGHEIDEETSLGHGSDDPSDPMGHEPHDPTLPLGHETDNPTEELGHVTNDETDPMGHGTHDETAQWVMGSMTPILTPRFSSSLSPQEEIPEASAGTPVDNLSDGERETPASSQPSHATLAGDITDAWAKARADQGMPAMADDCSQIRNSVLGLLAIGQPVDYLIRVVTWMAVYHPGWRDVAHARTAKSAPLLVPGSRLPQPPTMPVDPPTIPRHIDRPDCLTTGCAGHNHGPCDRTGFLVDPELDGALRCPCWFQTNPRF